MKPHHLALAAALCLLLTSCVVTSDNPLSPPDTAHPDPKLVGDWLDQKDRETYHITATKGAWMHVVITVENPAPGRKSDEYDFFPTTIGNNTFLNVVLVGKNDKTGKINKTYTLVRYMVEGTDEFYMWTMSQDAAAEAVHAGQLKGKVEQDKDAMMVGTPPHPDVNVALTASTADLAQFVQHTDLKNLFTNMNTFVRIIPGSK